MGRFRLRQDGLIVAGASGSEALREIMHYAMVYGQDGPCEIEVYRSGRWRELTTSDSSAKGEG